MLYISRFENSLLQYIKQYPCKFLSKTVVQKNGYFLYFQRNNSRYHEILYPQNHIHTFQIDNF